MAIKTSTFSGWRLSGKDADAFVKQINHASPNLYARAASERGQKLAEEYFVKGYVTISPKKNKEKCASKKHVSAYSHKKK
jgi:hypothetical protein